MAKYKTEDGPPIYVRQESTGWACYEDAACTNPIIIGKVISRMGQVTERIPPSHWHLRDKPEPGLRHVKNRVARLYVVVEPPQ